MTSAVKTLLTILWWSNMSLSEAQDEFRATIQVFTSTERTTHWTQPYQWGQLNVIFPPDSTEHKLTQLANRAQPMKTRINLANVSFVSTHPNPEFQWRFQQDLLWSFIILHERSVLDTKPAQPYSHYTGQTFYPHADMQLYYRYEKIERPASESHIDEGDGDAPADNQNNHTSNDDNNDTGESSFSPPASNNNDASAILCYSNLLVVMIMSFLINSI